MVFSSSTIRPTSLEPLFGGSSRTRDFDVGRRHHVLRDRVDLSSQNLTISSIANVVPGIRGAVGALTIDDTFAIHDVVLFENMGISERRVFLIYSIPVIWYLVRFRRELLDREDSALFMVGLLFLGSSLAIDVIHRPFPFAPSIEDLAKLLGITAWLYFFFRATLDVVTQTHLSSEPSQ